MKIAVFCGSHIGTEPKYAQAARDLGKWIGIKGHTLVFGGGNAGLMGIVSKEVHEAGGEVIGVVPENIKFIAELPQDHVTRLIRARDMGERKKIMIELADAYIALPGGIGTLDEISETIALAKLGQIDKPSILLDINGFYSPIRELMNRMIRVGFQSAEDIRRVLISEDMEEIERFI